MARGAGRGNYSMETIILNISVKRGGEAIIQEGGDSSRDCYYSWKYGTFRGSILQYLQHRTDGFFLTNVKKKPSIVGVFSLLI